MKPLRGKRVDPQSQLEKLSSARGSGQARIGILATRPSCFPGLRRVHFSRVERHDWSRGGYKPPGKVGTGFVFVLLQPWGASRLGTEERPRWPSSLPGLPGEFDWWGLGNRARRPLPRDGSG